MQIKLLEVRDSATFLPVFAISTKPENSGQGYLLRRCGFNSGDAVILARLRGEAPSSADAYFWNDRTMQTAHLYIEKHFDQLKDGDVVDVQFILGETDKPKTSERNESYA
jgi:hypothetical protein